MHALTSVVELSREAQVESEIGHQDAEPFLSTEESLQNKMEQHDSLL